MLGFPTDTDLIGVWIPALLAGIAVLSLKPKIRELENTVLFGRTLQLTLFIPTRKKNKTKNTY